jgi:hypothetical protein
LDKKLKTWEVGFEITPPPVNIKKSESSVFFLPKKLFSSSRRVKFVVIVRKNSQLKTLVQNEVGPSEEGQEDIFDR